MCMYCYSHTSETQDRKGNVEKRTDYFCKLREEDPDVMLELHNIFVVADLESRHLVDNCPVAYVEKWKICPYFEERK